MDRAPLSLQPENFFPHLFAGEPLEVHSLSSSAASFAGYLWQGINAGNRSEWDDRDWSLHLSDITVLFYAAYSQGEPIGAFELQIDASEVLLTGFGLLANYSDIDYDQHLLTLATEKAFSFGRPVLKTADNISPTIAFRRQGFRS